MELLTSLSYLFNDINDTTISVYDMDNDIRDYFNLKAQYTSFIDNILFKKSANPSFNSSNRITKNLKTNMPLEFIETPGKLTINVLDDITREILFQKIILTTQSVDINKRTSELILLIKNNFVINSTSSLQNKLKSLILAKEKLEIHKRNNLILESEAIEKIEYLTKKITDLEEEYNSFRKNSARWLLELDILNSIRRDEIIKYDNNYSAHNLIDVYLQIKSRDNFNNLIDSKSLIKDVLKNDRIINAILYQKNENQIGSIIFNTDTNEYGILKENLNTFIQTVKISDFDNITSVVPIRSIKLITGIHTKLDLKLAKSFFVSVDDINKKFKESGFETYYPEVTIDIKIENYGGKDEYIKKDIYYLKNPVSIKDSELKQNKVSDNENKEEVPRLSDSLIQRYKNLFDTNLDAHLVFYNKGDTVKYPGNGYKERISLEIKKNMMMDALFNTPNWRRILSNQYMNRDLKTGKIIPIVIDNYMFASVEHYLYFKQYFNKPGIFGEKLQQYNEYAMRYELQNNSVDNYGDLDADTLTDIEYLGYEPRDDWDKIRNDEAIKAIYAKFTQQFNLKSALLNTKFALLYELKNNGELEIALNLMKVRLMINKGDTPDNYKNYNQDRMKFLDIYDKLIRPETNKIIQKEVVNIPVQDKNLLKGYYWLSIYDDNGDIYNIAIQFDKDESIILGFYDEDNSKITYLGDSNLDDSKLEELSILMEQSLEDITEDDSRLNKIDYYLNKKMGTVFIKKDNKEINVGFYKDKNGFKYIDFN